MSLIEEAILVVLVLWQAIATGLLWRIFSRLDALEKKAHLPCPW